MAQGMTVGPVSRNSRNWGAALTLIKAVLNSLADDPAANLNRANCWIAPLT